MGSALIAVLIMSEQTDGLTILGSVSSVFLIIGSYIHICKYPSAIDVYRGKTTLQVTYKNNVPIDTTVIYK